jgi:hypothetical protein
MMTTTIRSSMSVKPFLLRIYIWKSSKGSGWIEISDVNYGAVSEKTTGKL